MNASRRSLVLGSAVAGIAALLLGSPVEADTLYWGGGSVDVAEATPLPTDAASLSGTWDLTIQNWAADPAGAVYQAWDPNDGSVVANLGTLSSGSDDAQILLAEDLSLGGLVLRNALIASTTGNTKQFVLDAAAPTTLTLGSGFVFDVSGTSGNYSHLDGSLVLGANLKLAGSNGFTKIASFLGSGNTNNPSPVLNIHADGEALTGTVNIVTGRDPQLGSLGDLPAGGVYVGGTTATANLRGISTFNVGGKNIGGGGANGNILVLDNNAAGQVLLNSAAVVNLAGNTGTLKFIGRPGDTQTIGKIGLRDYGVIDVNTARGAGGTLYLGDAASGGFDRGASGLGTLMVYGSSHAVTVNNSGNVYTVDALLPWATNHTAQFLTVDSNSQLVPVTTTDTTDLSTINGAGTDFRISNGASVANGVEGAIPAGATVKSLGIYAGNAITIPLGGTLTITDGAFAPQIGSGGNISVTGGSITTGDPNKPLYISTGRSGGSASSITVTSQLTGFSDLVYSGQRRLILSNTGNDYTGTTYVQSGELQVTVPALPDGDVIVSPYAMLNASSNAINGDRDITLHEKGRLQSGGNTLGGVLTMNDGEVTFTNADFTLNNAGTGLAFNGGVFRGTNAAARGNLLLQTNVSYAAASKAQAQFVGAAPDSDFRLVIGLGTAVRTFDIQDASANRPAATSDMDVHAVMTTGTGGGINKTGNGTLEFSVAMPYTGTTTITAGNLLLSGGGPALSLVSTSTGTNAGSDNQGGLALSDVSGLILGQTIASVDDGGAYPAGTYIRAIRTATNRVWLSANASSSLSGSSTINFAPAYALNNGSDIALNGGALVLGSDYALDPAGPANLTFGGGAVRYGQGVSVDISSRFAPIAAGQQAIIDTNGNDVAFAGALAGDGGLLKTGDGRLALNASNTYQGQTTVAGGILGGGGSLAGGLVIQNTATLAPGNSAGSLEVASLELQPGAVLDIQLGGTAFVLNDVEEYDRVKVSGDATLAGLLNVSLIDGFSLSSDGMLFGIVDVGGALSGAFTNFAEGDTILSDGGFDLRITYAGLVTDSSVALTGGNDVVLFAVVPEPASLSVLAMGALVLARRQRRGGC